MAIFEVEGTALTFYIIPCKKRAALSKSIKDNGGKMAIQRRQANYQLYNPGDIVSNPEMVSSKFIEDCAEQKVLLDVEEYRYTSQQKKGEHKDKKKPEEANFAFEEPSTSRVTQSSSISSQRRAGFSNQEDMAIIRSVLKLSKTHSVNGNKLWEIMTAEKVTNRSSLSMKERFIKKILPYISNYDLEDKELRKLKTLQSSKSFKVAKKAGVTQRRKELDFLRAPRPADQRSVFDLSSTSSSEDEPQRLSHSAVNKALVKRKKLVELSSNSSDSPSSQSQSQENNNQSTVTRGNNAVSDQPGRLKKMLLQLGYTQADKVAASRITDRHSASIASTSKKNVDNVQSEFSTDSSPESLVCRITSSKEKTVDTTKGKAKEQCDSGVKSKTGSGSKQQPKKAVGTSSVLMSDNSQETQNSQRSSKSSQESKESRRSTRSSYGSYIIQDSSPDIQDGKRAKTNPGGLTDDDLALFTSPVVKQPTTLSTRLSEKSAESTRIQSKLISATSTPQKNINTRITPHTSKDDPDGQICVHQTHEKFSTEAKDSASTATTKDQTTRLSKLETASNVSASPTSAFRVAHKVKAANGTSDCQKVSPKVKVTRSSNRNQSNNQHLPEAAMKSDDNIFPSTQPFTVEDDSFDSPNKKKKTRTIIEQSQERSTGSKEIGSDGDNENSIFPCTQPFTVSTESGATTDTETPDPGGVHNVSAGTPVYDIQTSTQPFVVLEDISKLSDSLNSTHVPEGQGVNDHNESPRRSVRISHQANEDASAGKGNNSKFKQSDELVKDSQSPAKKRESQGPTKHKESQGSNKSNIESQQSNQSSILCDLPLAQLDKRYSPALETQNSDSSVEFICETKRRSDTPEVPPPAPQPAPRPTCIPTSSQFGAGDADSQLFAKPLSSSTQVEPVPPPVTDSDERFRSDLLSDSYMASDDDVWPCASPPATPARPATPADPEQQHKASSQPAMTNKQDLKAKSSSKSPQKGNDKASSDVVNKTFTASEKANDNITAEKRSVDKEVKIVETTNNLEMESMPPPAPKYNVTKAPCTADQLQNEGTPSQQDKLSWSTFDFNTQRSDDLSGNSSNAGNSNQPDGSSTLPTMNELPTLPNIEHSPLNSRKRKHSTGSGIDNFVLPNAVKQLISDCDHPSLHKPSVLDDVVNQSWSERSDSCSPLAQIAGASPTVSPPRSPKRKCRLGDIVQQPLHKPEYADANSTLNTTLTQESKYVDCESRCESEDSFASAEEEPTPKMKEDDTLLNESKHCDEQSNSIVKTEALSPRKIKKRVRSPKKASMVLQSDQPVASTSTANAEPAVSLFINKCDSCQADTKGKAQCLIDKIKSDENYSKLMMTHRIEDERLFGYVVGLSADWELIDQHFKSGLKLGKLWTEKDDRMLMSSFNAKKNKQLLKRRFTDREMKNRRTFLLEYTDISAKQRAALLGMG